MPCNVLHDLDDLVNVPNSDEERKFIVVFHNLKGFEGMFILHELYQQQREVVDQLTVGAKVLSFSTLRLCSDDILEAVYVIMRPKAPRPISL